MIPERFNGPPGSGHGGYSCAMAARFVDGPAEVSLRAPPPLGRALRVERDGHGVRLRDGDTLVAEARPADVDVGEPPRVGVEEARAAGAESRFRRPEDHAFPTCFACGPLRDAGDGLRIFAGPVGDGVWADVWTPAAEFSGPEFAWAALDCPSSAPALADGLGERFGPFVLARLGVRVEAPLEPGRDHVIVSWGLAGAAHKQTTAAALLGPAGDVVAVARALWIGLRGRRAP